MEPLLRRIDKTGHLLWGFTFDAHGQAKRADFQVADLAIEQLPHQVGGLLAVERARAVLAPANFFDVCTDAHARIVSQARATLRP